MRNVAEPFKTKVDSNKALQESDPTWYLGMVPTSRKVSAMRRRTEANVRDAAIQIGVDTMIDDAAKERVMSMVHK